jgi:hypothetical protein
MAVKHHQALIQSFNDHELNPAHAEARRLLENCGGNISAGLFHSSGQLKASLLTSSVTKRRRAQRPLSVIRKKEQAK